MTDKRRRSKKSLGGEFSKSLDRFLTKLGGVLLSSFESAMDNQLDEVKRMIGSDIRATAGVDEDEPKAEDVLHGAYRLLGVSVGDPLELVTSVWRTKMRFFHPDKGGSTEQAQLLNRAYELVKADIERRGGK